MFDWEWITGMSLGIEYMETEEFGFVLTASLGFIRVYWFKDLEEMEGEDEE
jgi:hypothetical protein